MRKDQKCGYRNNEPFHFMFGESQRILPLDLDPDIWPYGLKQALCHTDNFFPGRSGEEPTRVCPRSSSIEGVFEPPFALASGMLNKKLFRSIVKADVPVLRCAKVVPGIVWLIV